ncbi:hypothetical protein PF002_g17430 [Phytophthora fragariae]|uniref:Integrase catalytic domain-containing protein n=1 Tax=Phytophthora fragariae TaxID=53985 RepID=A0A6A3YAQ5_9STRA|nr:hypothetical protein PF002_g17430 [Phytophthora fragariae]
MAEPLKYTSEGVPKNWNGKDWQQYKWAMMIVFRKKKLVEIVEGSITRPSLTSAEAEDDFDEMQLAIMQIIEMSLPADIVHQVRDKTTGTDMTTMAHRAESIRHELEMIKLLPGGDVNKHLSKMFNLRTELLSLNYPFDDVAMVEMILNSLPHQYEFESLKSGVCYNSADNFITPERTRELIRVADSRQKAYQAKSGTGQRGNQKIGATGGAGSKVKTGNGEDQQLGGKFKDSKKKRPKKCFICGSTEHLRAECPDRVEGNHGGGANANEQKRKPRANMTTRHDASREVDSSSENDELEEVLSRLDALIIDAGLVGDSCEDEGLVTSEEEEVREESDSHAHIGWWYDGQDHDEGEVNTSSGWWYFDTAANVHVTGNPWYYVTFTPDPSQSQHIQGVTAALASRIAGVGTVAVITMVDGQQATVTLNDVFYVPGATNGLFSIGLAAEQGFDFDYDRQTEDFRVQDEGRTVIVASPHEATWGFQVTHPSNGNYVGPQDQPLSNFTAAEGVASLKLWHERLGHTCPQYLKMMVDKGLVRGMLMKQRDLDTCDACHIGKQKKKPHLKKLERNTKTPNQVVYADLLIPSKDNGTRFEAVLIIMDGFSRFVTLHMLTSKSSEVVNRHIKEYVLWAERQAGRHKVRQVLTRTLHVVYKVYQILTDKGGEFVNTEMESRYKAHGIEHVLVGPKSSQLNLCERTHQSLVEMMKASMHDAGFPKTLWPEALRNAVYIKNRIYNKGTCGVPYEMLFGVKPDLHHVRKFGALAYVHVPVTPGRKKHHDNARLGFVLGYAEDVIGCKVYFPENRTAKFVSDLRVAEDVMYRDRHEVTVENGDLGVFALCAIW